MLSLLPLKVLGAQSEPGTGIPICPVRCVVIFSKGGVADNGVGGIYEFS